MLILIETANNRVSCYIAHAAALGVRVDLDIQHDLPRLNIKREKILVGHVAIQRLAELASDAQS